MTGADERVIEASWGLGEAVVAGLVIPDTFRVDRSTARCSNARPGSNGSRSVRCADGGTVEEDVPASSPSSSRSTTAGSSELNALALRCEEVYGKARDIEWAFADGTLYLLQCRAVTTGRRRQAPAAAATATDPVDVLPTVPLFAGLDAQEVEQIARLFKVRHFAAGETVITRGLGRRRVLPDRLGGGDGLDPRRRARHPDAGRPLRRDRADRRGSARWRRSRRRPTSSATGSPTGSSVRSCQDNGAIGWKLLQSMAKMLRSAEEEAAVRPSASASASEGDPRS